MLYKSLQLMMTVTTFMITVPGRLPGTVAIAFFVKKLKTAESTLCMLR